MLLGIPRPCNIFQVWPGFIRFFFRDQLKLYKTWNDLRNFIFFPSVQTPDSTHLLRLRLLSSHPIARKNIPIMVSLKIIAAALMALLSLSTHNLVDSAPAHIDKRALNSGAPLASDVGGASIIMDNDVDTATSKVSFLLLSKPRGYYDGMSACSSMNSGKTLLPHLSISIRKYHNLICTSPSNSNFFLTFLAWSASRIHLHPRHGRRHQPDQAPEQQRARSERSLCLQPVLGL